LITVADMRTVERGLIGKLRAQLVILDEVIATLKALQPEVNEALRKRRAASAAIRARSPEARRMISERFKKYYSDPEKRRAIGERTAKYWASQRNSN